MVRIFIFSHFQSSAHLKPNSITCGIRWFLAARVTRTSQRISALVTGVRTGEGRKRSVYSFRYRCSIAGNGRSNNYGVGQAVPSYRSARGIRKIDRKEIHQNEPQKGTLRCDAWDYHSARDRRRPTACRTPQRHSCQEVSFREIASRTIIFERTKHSEYFAAIDFSVSQGPLEEPGGPLRRTPLRRHAEKPRQIGGAKVDTQFARSEMLGFVRIGQWGVGAR
jgi:hypothetical protein